MKDQMLAMLDAEMEAFSLAVSNSDKVDRLNNIIQLKIHAPFNELKNGLYVNVKSFLYLYPLSLQEKQFQYDEFDDKIIIDYIEQFDVNQQYSLLEFLIRNLKLLGFDDQHALFEEKLTKVEFKKILESRSALSIFKLIYLAAVYNIYAILSSLLLLFLINFIILLPAPATWPVHFAINYIDISKNFYLNHFCNILLSIFDFHSDPFVMPTSVQGALLLFLGKLFYAFIVLNVFITQISKRVKI